MPCRGSFKTGFKAGYRFANGGYDSCEPPQLRHYWRIGGLTESERLNAQAWSDGFTHGTVAAQQDHTAGLSALDMAARQPPEGVPDVRYYTPPQPPAEMGQDGGYPYSPNMQSPPSFQESPPPGYGYPPMAGENFQYAPNAGNPESAPNAGNIPYAPMGPASNIRRPSYRPRPRPRSRCRRAAAGRRGVTRLRRLPPACRRPTCGMFPIR